MSNPGSWGMSYDETLNMLYKSNLRHTFLPQGLPQYCTIVLTCSSRLLRCLLRQRFLPFFERPSIRQLCISGTALPDSISSFLAERRCSITGARRKNRPNQPTPMKQGESNEATCVKTVSHSHWAMQDLPYRRGRPRSTRKTTAQSLICKGDIIAAMRDKVWPCK